MTQYFVSASRKSFSYSLGHKRSFGGSIGNFFSTAGRGEIAVSASPSLGETNAVRPAWSERFRQGIGPVNINISALWSTVPRLSGPGIG